MASFGAGVQNGGAGAVPVFEGATTMAIPDFMQECVDAIRLSIQSTDGMAVQTVYSSAEDRLEIIRNYVDEAEDIDSHLDDVLQRTLKFTVEYNENLGGDESRGSAVAEARRDALDALDALEERLQTVRLAAQPER